MTNGCGVRLDFAPELKATGWLGMRLLSNDRKDARQSLIINECRFYESIKGLIAAAQDNQHVLGNKY